MTDLFLYAIMVTLMSYAILEVYFSGHVFISLRTYFLNMKDRSAETKNPLGYFLGYLFTCYFCASYWVSWLVAYATYRIVFVEPLTVLSSALVVFGTGLFSVAALDLLNAFLVKESDEFGAFFPWNEYRAEDKKPEPDISDSVEDTLDNVVDVDSPTEITKE